MAAALHTHIPTYDRQPDAGRIFGMLSVGAEKFAYRTTILTN